AVRQLVLEYGVHHVDLNFGCPVRKITARGGGSALPLRPGLFARLVAAAVAGADGQVPVTVKMRVGLTPELSTALQAGRAAEAEGAAAITLHARTADQLYSPPVDWPAVRQLVEAVRIPVIGNGDVYEGADAVRLMAETGCAGVMVGRAALGRPWVFREVAAALQGRPPPPPPSLGEVARVALGHVEAEAAWYRGYDEGQRDSLRRFRKFVPLYLFGFHSAARLQARLLAAESLEQWRAAVYDDAGGSAMYDAGEQFPAAGFRHPRLKGGGADGPRQRMGLPDGWMEEWRGGGGGAEQRGGRDADAGGHFGRASAAGADARCGLDLGLPIELFAGLDGQPGLPWFGSDWPIQSSTWDAHSGAVYFAQGFAVMRLGSDNTVEVVAGELGAVGKADGPGPVARFTCPTCMASDGAGALYLSDRDRIRKLQLPPAWRKGEGRGPSLAAPTAAAGGPADAHAHVEGVVVSTLLLIDVTASIQGLCFLSGCGSGSGDSGTLVYGADSTIYRLPLGGASVTPVLLAGAEGEHEVADGVGSGARFNDIRGLVADGEGYCYCVDYCCDADASDVEDPRPLVLDLGLKPQHCHRPTSNAATPLPRTLPADLGVLLGRQPDGTADVTIVVGGRTFHAHRGLLCARSDYFQQRLGGGFAESSAQQLTLPEAAADAFGVVLRFVYTDAADIPAALAQAVAELADRLLLPELFQQATAVVEASVSPGTVAGLLLWAEARGPAFSELLSRLKAWYLENHEKAMQAAEEQMKLLAAQSPSLFFELMRNTRSQPSKRPRTRW
ncbi:putative tRNA-dihydrouridine synthase, partial [Tetrabaena socialis]